MSKRTGHDILWTSYAQCYSCTWGNVLHLHHMNTKKIHTPCLHMGNVERCFQYEQRWSYRKFRSTIVAAHTFISLRFRDVGLLIPQDVFCLLKFVCGMISFVFCFILVRLMDLPVQSIAGCFAEMVSMFSGSNTWMVFGNFVNI